jgi:hypothetical protein
MNRYMIEMPHDPDAESCIKVVETFHDTGAHYLTHADFGCAGGVHNAWLIIEADNAEEARLVAPPYYRNDAKVIQVKHYTHLTKDEIVADHQG